MRATDIARSGVSIALIIVFFSLFRGTTNIVNAVLVPLTLRMCCEERQKETVVLTIAALSVLILFFFRQQVFFLCIYIGLFLVLQMSARACRPLRFASLGTVAFVGFLMAIHLTDVVFLTNIQGMLARLVQGTVFGYYGVILVQAMSVSAVLEVLSGAFSRQMRARWQS